MLSCWVGVNWAAYVARAEVVDARQQKMRQSWPIAMYAAGSRPKIWEGGRPKELGSQNA